jgi:hypothetical protein
MGKDMMRTCKTIGRILALAWAVWWAFFGLLSGIGEGGSWVSILVHLAFPGLVFLAGVAVAWRWERIGGWVLILEGVFSYLIFTPLHSLWGILVMPLPPILGGLLIVIGAWPAVPANPAASSHQP